MNIVDLNMDKVFSSFQKQPEIFDNRELYIEIEHTYHKIISSTNQYGVLKTSELILEDLFHLKINLINKEHFIKNMLNNYNSLLEKGIIDIIDEEPIDLSLKTYYLKSLEVLKKIKSYSNEFSEYTVGKINNKITYTDLQTVFNSFPSKSSRLILETIQLSLIIDYLLIISDQILKNNLKVNDSEIFIIKDQLKTNIENYAMYLSFLDIWQPDDTDETEWIRNVKILIARNGFNRFSDTSQSFDSKQLKNILEN